MVVSEDQIDQINKKLDSVLKTVNTLVISSAEHLATDKLLRKRNDDTYKVVHGDGEHMGLKNKMNIIWGGIGLSYVIVIGLVVRHGF